MSIQNKGVAFGMISGFTWALDTVLIGIILSTTLFMSTESVIFLAPLVSTFFHDTFSSIWMMIYLTARGRLGETFKRLRTRSGLFVVIGALLGGPIGMTFYVLAVKYIGASMAASMSAIYPAIGAFFAFLILKDKLTFKNWVGLFISILFIFLLGYSSGGIESTNAMLGFIFILFCIFGWGMECVILAYGMKDEEIAPDQALQIRQLVSAVIYGFLILPLFGGYSLVPKVIMNIEFLYIAVIALSGTISYLFYYKAIYTIGPTRAMALNISYAAWAIILSFVITGTPITFKLVFFSVMILLGSIITVAKPEELVIKNILRMGRTA
ncbi:lic-1 operon protein [Bacillus sp. FJAT-27225]|uniref:DMT family transporter n=1 Tax=Bacillus sp. FJAT-27225 TaxID=1743144 RepID=UPI00080C2FCF|nr:DMT family transporter [Bacillus sp. FJAT-27225]OCA88283.1 lic-1 operon protein [Bacillus sp. FJAT-27225]